MTEMNFKLISLIEQGKTINEIKNELDLSDKQILKRLHSIKMDGINYLRNYYYDGEVDLELNKSIGIQPKVTSLKLNKEDSFRFVAISDLHIGSSEERIDLLNLIYDYCIKNNIHIIVNAGDLVEGANNFSNVEKNIYLSQIERLLKKHPYDKNILNFICLGNHDADSLRKDGINLSKILINNRFDLIPIGFGKGILKVKDDILYVIHPTPGVDIKIDTPNLVLRGHSHKLKTVYEDNHFTFYVPSLSNIKQVGSPDIPCFLDFNIVFSNGLFKKGYVATMIIKEKIYKFNETQLDFDYNKYNYKKIKK